MDKKELERWLCPADILPPAPTAIATGLGLPVEAIADTTLLRVAARLRSLRFTLALLRDAFAADIDVWRWLDAPHEELGGASPRDMLLAGRVDVVEELAVHAWHESTGAVAA
jgi:hypothetical protein